MNKNLRRVKKLILGLTIGCLSFSAIASDLPESEAANVSISPGKKRATIIMNAWNLSAYAPATVKILDKFGSVVYQEAVDSKDKHSKQYDFSKMESGKYTLVLESTAGEVNKPFIVGMNGVVREDKSKAYQNFRPVIIQKSKERSVFVGFSNVSDVPLKLTVTNTQGDVIYATEITGYQAYHQVINLKKLRPDNYTINVYNMDYSYQRDIKNY